MAEDKIQITDLITKRHEIVKDELFMKYLKDTVKVVPYISYATKMAQAKALILATCVVDGDIQVDSMRRYVFYIFHLINAYTNVEFHAKTIVDDFDLLDANGLVEPLLALIPEHERKTFETLVQMAYDDLMVNKNNVLTYIRQLVGALGQQGSALMKMLAQRIPEEAITELLPSK